MQLVGTGDAISADAARGTEAADGLVGTWFYAPSALGTVADAILIKNAALANGVAVVLLQQCIAETAGT
jgi:hypothetical protein